MDTKSLNYWERVRTSLWFIPSLMALAAIFLAAGTTALDKYIDIIHYLPFQFLANIQPDGARSMLTIIASAMMNVATVVFSITIVALTLASSQFGPRLLRNFMIDTGNQVVLGTFTATFIFCLLVLQSIQTTDDQTFLPNLSIIFALVLALINIGVLIYFIHHVAMSIQADHVVGTVINDLEAHLKIIFPDEWQPGVAENSDTDPASALEGRYSEHLIIVSCKSGYLQAVDKSALLSLASEKNLALCLLNTPGDFVVKNAPLVRVYRDQIQQDKTLEDEITQHFFIGTRRTPEQDPEFAIRQLVEIAVRALSPGINDPYTAMICIDQLSAILCQLAYRVFPSPYGYDENNTLRLVTRPVTFTGLTDEAFDQIRQYGRSSTSVTIRLLEAQISIAIQARSAEQRDAVFNQATMVERASRNALAEENDRKDVQRRYEELCEIVNSKKL